MVRRYARRYLVAAVGIMAALVCVLRPTFGAELKLPSGPYNYSVPDRDTKDLLEDFGKSVHIPVDVSGRIKGRPRGPLPTGTAQDFLNGVCESEAIVWYFDGAKLYFSAASETDSVIISLGPLWLQ
jgi:type II secretory pathway component GspD/PulD (secretin)